MTAIAAAAAVPGSGLEWRQWARRMIEELRLPSPLAHLLTVLVDRANAGGTVELGVPLMARQLGGLSESQVHRRLRALERDYGLLRTRQRGRGRIALRELVAAPAPAQLSLFDQATDEPVAAPVAASTPAARVVPAPPWPAPAVASSRISASKPSHQCEAAVEGQFVEDDPRAARAPHHTFNDPEGVLAPRLGEVLAILEPAIGPIVEPMAVQSALAAFPEDRGHDHLQAAHIVASYAFDTSGARAPISLLRQVLRNQLQAPKGPAGGGRWHGGRRRPAPPAMSPEMVEQTERETATMKRLMNQAGWNL
jgi:hypothetical protein